MMEGWKQITLGDVLHIKHGYGFKGEFFVEEPTKNILVTPGNFLIGGGFKNDKLKYYDGPIDDSFILSDGDVIVTMTDLSKQADTLGYSAKVPKSKGFTYLHNQRIGLISLLSDEYDLNFIYWLLRTHSYQRFIAGSSSGATVKHTSPKKIYSTKLTIPSSLKTQRKIASILSAYDDLIENNLKRIQLLEEQAQLTYEEWFVRFKFPGHEEVEFVDGLPEGWEEKDLNYLCEKVTDGTHASPKQVEQGYKLITGKHIGDGFINFEDAYLISEDDHFSIRKRSGLERGDILFSNIGTLGNVGIVTEDFEYSCKNVIIFKNKAFFNYYLYCFLTNKNTKKNLDNQSSGVAQKFYSLTFIRNFKDNFPNKDLIKRFDDVVRPLFNLKYNLFYQNQLLKEARDILLPRLMSGMIDVENIEMQTELIHERYQEVADAPEAYEVNK